MHDLLAPGVRRRLTNADVDSLFATHGLECSSFSQRFDENLMSAGFLTVWTLSHATQSPVRNPVPLIVSTVMLAIIISILILAV